MTSIPVKFGDVFICSFPFTSGQLGKPRPVLALLDLGQDCLIARITSVPHTDKLDVSIAQWKQAGLEKPSVVRLTRLVTAEKTLLKTKIGSPGHAAHVVCEFRVQAGELLRRRVGLRRPRAGGEQSLRHGHQKQERIGNLHPLSRLLGFVGAELFDAVEDVPY
ncbi:MAG: type II toxin-antitoxin system PemK/MazF family toxin, partial [Candidatus Binatia bacterium]